MELVARKVRNYGDWYKLWHLVNVANDKVVGEMVFNSNHTTGAKFPKYHAFIRNPLHPALGNVANKSFNTLNEALVWSREQIENLPTPTAEDYKSAIERVKDARYRDEMSDDFAYTNGKIAYWIQVERELRNMMENAK